MTNLPGSALRRYWNPTAFAFEFITVLFLVFFVFTWMFLSFLSKKNKNKVFLSVGYTIATALAFFLPWAFASIGSKLPVYPMLNPLVVIFQSFLRGFGKTGQVVGNSGLIGAPLWQGLPYIFAAQIIGGFAGFALFIGLFYSFKLMFKNNNEYEWLKSFGLAGLFVKDHQMTLGKYSIKEAIFITMLIAILPFSAMIDTTNYQLNHFQIKLIEILIVGIIIFISSYFDFFAFHLIFPLIELVIKTALLVKSNSENKKENTKAYLQSLYKFLIVLALTIIIPIIIAFIAIAIKSKTGVIISVS
ncbi:hypothetical protein MBOVJF4428_00126 [Mycoplasmopsis agalactiae]|uniref:Transmembrane protein n=1 Tax=Mycoplasmopsis agalactiae (strain NCTC 10123 / CIP 59.7 / PG2) TaxID=347257 RepID=A5IYT3_MYCAP|nr:hypothetical protein [Mycoplasmopsis agalactiae]MCE6057227.1 hypothetical protein [Mycoplasmopsis agalactiae]MCE6079014.1 hypothetical protein [Mycoplasmopsis agalactiae]MCE6095401.1 hypothetical protein [Mycoplasmopsis agalactiae]MCE6114656.1 hypothetical protein [Mycoplasmopsis agalactiae]NLS34503.1 hypothetical protein [Mycoplasmopsis agalactiae]